MLDIVDIRKVISQMRKIGADTQTCELKEAVQAIPKSLTFFEQSRRLNSPWSI